MNEFERQFYDEAIARGYVVLRNGLPDFFIIKDGTIQGVEVKDVNDHVKTNQM